MIIHVQQLLLLSLIVGTLSSRKSYDCSFNLRKFNESLQHASLIISATVLHVTADPRNDRLQIATVRVKRIFKGLNIINARKKIAIHGLGSTQICHSILHERDTKIILLNELNGLFYLNSSLISVNLSILDHLNDLFQGWSREKQRHIKRTKCEKVRCPYGAKCRPYNGKCECRSFCNTVGPTVCGTDNVSYLSECHLAVRSCLARTEKKSEIRVKQIGACEKRNPCEDLRCGPGEQCVISENGNDYISAHCICQEQCDNFGDSVESSPVCSNDGIDYPSLCHLQAHACKTKRNESVKYYGKCDPCKDFVCSAGTICKVTSDRRAECRCSQQCSMYSDPVCATDGNTYENECLMSVSSCRHDSEVMIYHKGRCKENNPCKLVHCSDVETCHIQENGTAICKCIQYCPPVTKPICSINGKTYENECVMRRSACMSNMYDAVRHIGPCGFGVCVGYDGCRPFEVCVDRNGHPVCECETCDSQLNEKYSGVCDGCTNVHCEFYAICVSDGVGNGSCRCPDQCDYDNSGTICATDGITYLSECHMRLAACQQQKFIVIAFRGFCDSCSSVVCLDGQQCEDGICSCPNNCPDATENSTVCGSDGMLYPSKCHLKMMACRKNSAISVQHLDNCQFRKIDECSCNRIGSYNSICNQHGQCRCLPGVGGNKCDHCLSGFWGLHLIAKGALGCQPCGCSAFGSSRFDCEQSSGRCQCKPDSYGIKCDSCGPDSILTSNGCLEKTGFHIPKDCSELRCHHGAVCVIALSGTPICKCSKKCSLDHLGIVAEMTICGSDGDTYDNICELQQFACMHQLDIVPSTLGVCPRDVSNGSIEMQRRRERKLIATPILGNLCIDDNDCRIFNTYCAELNILKLRSCVCRQGFFPSKDMMQCIQEKNIEQNNSWMLNGIAGIQVITKKVLNHLFSIQMQIRAHNISGILLYSGLNKMNDFIVLLLSDSKLIFSFSLNSEIFTMKWDAMLEMNRSYKIRITLLYNQVLLAVDDLIPVIFKLPSAVISHPFRLDLPLHFGYTPIQLLSSHSTQKMINNFTGCLSDIFINGRKISKSSMKFLGNIVHCSQNRCVKSCMNGSLCLLDDSNTKPICRCIQYFNDQLCEQQICEGNDICGNNLFSMKIISKERLNTNPHNAIPLFVGDGLLMKQNLRIDVKESLEMEIWLKAMDSDGLVFYWTNLDIVTGQYAGGDFVALILIASQPYFFWSLGSGIVYSRFTASLSNDQFHSVAIGKHLRSDSLQVDNKQIKTQISQLGYSRLDENGAAVFIGGVPNKTILPSALSEFAVPFRGAVQRLTINGHTFFELFKEFQQIGRIMHYSNVLCSNAKYGNRSCVPNLNDYSCQCLDEYQISGYIKQDEEANGDSNDSILLDGRNKYVLMKKMISKKQSKVLIDYEFMVKTNKSEGLIWWESKRHTIRSDYLAIFLLTGRIGFAANLGSNQKVKMVGSNTIINDNRWHSIALLREKRKFLLTVDNEVVTYISPSGATELTTDRIIWIAGKRKIPRSFPVKTPYKGCLRNLRISSQLINIRREFSSNQEFRGCEN
ncbi:Agrin [Dirofilaria immitis]